MVPKKKIITKTKKEAASPAREKTALEIGSEMIQKIFKSKKLSDPFVSINEDDFKKSMPHLPTGSTMVDYLIGGRLNRFGIPPCPGLPKGKIINLYGRESAGKTTLALTIAAKTIANGGTVAYIDWENAIVNDYAKSLGVPIEDTSKFRLSQPTTLEEGVSIIWAFVKLGVDLIVIDSVGAGVPRAVMEQAIDEKGKAGRVGAIAQIWSTFLPQVRTVSAQKGTCVLGISQLRKSINTSGFGASDGSVTQGGEAWKFYSDVRMGMIRIKSEKSKEYDRLNHQTSELSSGVVVRVRADKCKVSASQGRDVELYIRYGEGIDDLRSIIDFAGKHGILRKDGAWYSWERGNGEVIKGQGIPSFKNAVLEADGAYEELYKKTTMKIYSSDEVLMDSEVEEDTSIMELDNILAGKNADGSDPSVEDSESDTNENEENEE